jgi:hypothetical protein
MTSWHITCSKVTAERAMRRPLERLVVPIDGRGHHPADFASAPLSIGTRHVPRLDAAIAQSSIGTSHVPRVGPPSTWSWIETRHVPAMAPAAAGAAAMGLAIEAGGRVRG